MFKLPVMNTRQIPRLTLLFFVALFCVPPALAQSQDAIEFLSGAKIQGKVTNIDKQAKKVTFESKIGTRTSTRTYPYSRIHAVTFRGKRYVLTEKTGGATGTGSASNAGDSVRRSRTEVETIINDIGRSAPDWLESTQLNIPNTLDLSWPLKPPGKGWNQNKNVGQFFWSVINPNPSRWKEGVKLVHLIMPRHQGDAALLRRDWMKLGTTYFELFQDYPRAAFWFRQARVTKNEPANVMLAECYWRLGNRQMALEQLKSRTMPMNAIKLYGDLGETQMALQLANQAANSQPQQAYLLAGDACRTAEQFSQAISYYTKVLNSPKHRNKDYDNRFRGRARESIETIKLFDQADVAKVADGTYRATSTGYNGPLEVEVKVANGKIDSLRVSKHQEKQFYSALTDTTNQIIKKQSVKGIDATTRATITSQAIVNASAKALAQGAN